MKIVANWGLFVAAFFLALNLTLTHALSHVEVFIDSHIWELNVIFILKTYSWCTIFLNTRTLTFWLCICVRKSEWLQFRNFIALNRLLRLSFNIHLLILFCLSFARLLISLLSSLPTSRRLDDYLDWKIDLIQSLWLLLINSKSIHRASVMIMQPILLLLWNLMLRFISLVKILSAR